MTSADDWEREAEAYRDGGDMMSALRALEQAVNADPSSTRHRVNLATALRSMGRKQEAYEYLREMMAWNPEEAEIWRLFALICLDTERDGDADLASRRAVAIDPDEAVNWVIRGIVLSDTGELDGAEQALKTAVELAPDDAFTYVNLGVVYDRQGDSQRAISVQRKAASLEPENPEMWAHLGLFQLNAKEYDDAESSLLKAIESGSSHPWGHYWLSVLYERTERYEEALDEIWEAIENDPEEPEFRIKLAEWLFAAGAFDDAEGQLAAALAADPDNYEAKSLADQIRIRRASGGDPDLTVFVHDHSEQLISLVNLLMHCHALLVRGCGRVDFELKTEGGEADQTHYAVTGFILRGHHPEEDTAQEVDALLAEWKGPHQLNMDGSVLELTVGVRDR